MACWVFSTIPLKVRASSPISSCAVGLDLLRLRRDLEREVALGHRAETVVELGQGVRVEAVDPVEQLP